MHIQVLQILDFAPRPVTIRTCAPLQSLSKLPFHTNKFEIERHIEATCLDSAQLKTAKGETSKWYEPRFHSPCCSLHDSHWPQLLCPLGSHKHCSLPSVSSCTSLFVRNLHNLSQHVILCFKAQEHSAKYSTCFLSVLICLFLLAPQSHQ